MTNDTFGRSLQNQKRVRQQMSGTIESSAIKLGNRSFQEGKCIQVSIPKQDGYRSVICNQLMRWHLRSWSRSQVNSSQ